MIRAIIFDCFGVLMVDSFEKLLAPIREHDPELAARIIAISAANNRGLIDPEEARRQTAELLGMEAEEFERRKRAGEVKNEDVLAFAGSLRPEFKTAVLSNVGRAGLERRFVPGELEKYFDVVVVSGDIGFAKPEPQAYEIAAERLGVPAMECVMIDDRAEYCAGAEAVGMRAIRFETFAQLKRDLPTVLQGSDRAGN